MEIKKFYVEPETREDTILLESSFLASENLKGIEDAEVREYDSDFWD